MVKTVSEFKQVVKTVSEFKQVVKATARNKHGPRQKDCTDSMCV